MSEAAGQARTGSGNQFTPTFPESMRDTQQRTEEKKPVTADAVLALVRSHEPITRAQLAVRLGIKPPALNTFISQLSGSDLIYKDDDGYRAREIIPQSSEPLHPVEEIASAIESTLASPTRSLDEPTEHLFDAELTAALDVINSRLSKPKGIKLLKTSDIRIVALQKLMPMLADDISEQFESLIAEVTMAGAQ